jgi:hypothetical protein
MRHLTGRDRLIGGAVLVVLFAMAPSVIEWMVASRSARALMDARATATAQATRGAVSVAANEAVVLEDIRRVITAQAAYRAANHGFYESNLGCLVSPKGCIPFYPPNAPTFLDSRLATLADDSGYHRSFTVGTSPPLILDVSPSSVTSYRYDAWPVMVGHSGVRGFAADASGRICFTPDGAPVSQVAEGKLEPTCTSLESFEPRLPSPAASGRPVPDLRVREAGVEASQRPPSSAEPLYSFVVTLENASARPVVLSGVRRLFFAPGDAGSGDDWTMGTDMALAPGATLTLGRDEPAPLSRVKGIHFLVVAIRYGDAEDYRTNRGQTFVFKWKGAAAGVVPLDLQIPPEDEAARVRKEAFARGGWWGESGPEQGLAAGILDAGSGSR